MVDYNNQLRTCISSGERWKIALSLQAHLRMLASRGRDSEPPGSLFRHRATHSRNLLIRIRNLEALGINNRDAVFGFHALIANTAQRSL